jgi:hypothetical protein
VSKRRKQFAANQADWSTFNNFATMYDGAYDEMVAVGVAKHLNEKVWMDKDGNIGVESKEMACGIKVDTVLTHLDYVLFVDKVGNNMKQKNDGHVGGGKYLCERGTMPKQTCATKDAHFTVLGFTSANGQPVMCVIILKGKQVKLEWSAGIDMQKLSIGEKHDPDYFEANSGPGKLLPANAMPQGTAASRPIFFKTVCKKLMRLLFSQRFQVAPTHSFSWMAMAVGLSSHSWNT